MFPKETHPFPYEGPAPHIHDFKLTGQEVLSGQGLVIYKNYTCSGQIRVEQNVRSKEQAQRLRPCAA